jgi:hypothetical protein
MDLSVIEGIVPPNQSVPLSTVLTKDLENPELAPTTGELVPTPEEAPEEIPEETPAE